MKAAKALVSIGIVLATSPSVSAQAPSQDFSADFWRIDSTSVNPVLGARTYRALLAASDSTAFLLLVCDASRRLYTQFFTRPLRQGPASLYGGLPATFIAYRFGDDRPTSGWIVWQADQTGLGNAMWLYELRRLRGLDARPFWRGLERGSDLVVGFQGLEGEFFAFWRPPANTPVVARFIRARCESLRSR